jgi:hypothetical protein
MPAKVNKASNPARFELPALNLNFGSITDGTNIPPPPVSPVEKAPVASTIPIPPPNGQDKENKKPANGAAKTTAAANGKIAGTKRSADDGPPSPTPSGRPGSLRRLFSRTMLSNSYTEGQLSTNGNGAAAAAARPGSQSGGSFLDDRKSKRNSGFFRRLRGDGGAKRSSLLLDTASSTTSPKKPSGPPPPMIPEVEVEKDTGAFGSDLFKNIN